MVAQDAKQRSELVNNFKSGGNMSNNWYYSKDGKQQFGPFDDSNFSSLATQGSIGPKDYVRTDSMKKWVLAENIKGLNFLVLPEISIPFVTQAKDEIIINNPPMINSVTPGISKENNETVKTSTLNKEPLETPKPANPEVKTAVGGIGTTMLTAGAGAAIGLGVGALLGNAMSSSSNQTSNLIDTQGLSQRLKILNMQGLLSDYDYRTILQIISNQPIGSSRRIIQNQPKKNQLTSNIKKNSQSSSNNLVVDDDSLDDETLINEENDIDSSIEGKNSEFDNQLEEEILDAEDVSSEIEDEDILDAEDLGDEEEVNTEEELDSSDDESDDENIEDEELQDDDMDEMEDDDLGDDDLGDDDYSTDDSGGSYSSDDD